MDMGPSTDARASLEALIAVAAPGPAPADHVLPLLRRLDETDPATLGRLAYHALTGVAPGEGEPPSPTAVAPGFPPFAAEVLMRAICGPEDRRPTTQALLIVLDTVPATSWPAAVAPTQDPAEESAEDPAPALTAEPERSLDPAPAPSRRAESDKEFRSLLNPSRTVPRFDRLDDRLDDPLSGPWEPEPALTTAAAATVEAGPDPETDPEAGPETDPAADPETDPTTGPDHAPEDEPQPVRPAGSGDRNDMHDEFRAFVSPTFAVPRFEPLEGELPAGSARVRRRREGGRPSRRDRRRRAAEAHEPEVAAPEIQEPEIHEPEIHEPETHEPETQEPGTQEPGVAELQEPVSDVPVEEPADEVEEPTEEEPDGDAEPAPVPEGRRGRAPRERQTVAYGTSAGDRKQTLVLVAVILVLILLGAAYAASREGESSGEPASPQGASRSMVQAEPDAE